MHVRTPTVAGQFYPGIEKDCIVEIEEYLAAIEQFKKLPENIVGGIAPHAGWMFSGELALMVFQAIKKQNESVDTFILFGAAHSYFGHKPAICDKGKWATPLGEIEIDQELAEKVIDSETAIRDANAHKNEHSIEVQVPFIQHSFPDAKILPILAPAYKSSILLGESVGEIVTTEKNKRIICIASTDLTHYGPRYGFTPMGSGEDGLQWAKDVNDKRFIDEALRLDAHKLLVDAAENGNACGPGATAACIAAAKKLGKTKGTLLAQTTSNEVMQKKVGHTSSESVGYAAIVF